MISGTSLGFLRIMSAEAVSLLKSRALFIYLLQLYRVLIARTSKTILLSLLYYTYGLYYIVSSFYDIFKL